MKNTFIFLLLVSLFLSCKKEENEVKTSGEVILSSEILGSEPIYYVEGFLFSEAKKIKYYNTSTPIPDLVLENNIQGEISGANLTSPQNNEAFYKAGEFENLSEAETFYLNLNNVGAASFSATASSISANQVYIFKSRENKYAKILIKDYNVFQGLFSKYVEITTVWMYQPNGETTFSSE